MDIKEIVKKKKELQQIINTNLDSVNPSVIHVIEGHINNAKQELELLKIQYFNELKKNIVVIAVSGNQSEEFANIAKYKYKVLTVDANMLNNELTKTLVARGGGASYTQNTHFTLLDEINKLKIKYNILHIQHPKIDITTDSVYDRPVEEALKILLTKNYGTELNSSVILRHVSQCAWDADFSSNILAVLAYNYTDNFGDNFMPKPLFVHECDGQPDDKTVLSVLKKAKNMTKPKETTENLTQVSENNTQCLTEFKKPRGRPKQEKTENNSTDTTSIENLTSNNT